MTHKETLFLVKQNNKYLMEKLQELLEKYLKLELSKDNLLNQIGNKNNDSSPIVVVTIDDVAYTIDSALKKDITKTDLSDWVNFVWFSGYYSYEDKNQENIAQILNDLEDTDELSDDAYSSLLNRVNSDLKTEKYPKQF